MDIKNDSVGAVKKDWEGASSDQPSANSVQIHTSQQMRGEHHLAEGTSGGASDSVSGTEMAPNGIATSKAIKDDTHTSQQLLGQFSTPESD